MPTVFDETPRRSLLRRFNSLRPEATPLWGKMDAHRMVCHCAVALRLSLHPEGEIRPRGALARWPLNWLVIHVVPWPKGKAEAPRRLLDTEQQSWDEDLASLSSLLRTAGERGADGDWPLNVAFGRISGRDWGALHYKHLDHHLRQFGV